MSATAAGPSAADARQRVALAALLAGAVAIAFAPIFVRLSELGPSATAFWRVAFAAPALMLWLTLEQRRLGPAARRPATARDWWLLALAGFTFAGDLAVWHWSIRLTSVANSTLFANFAPIFVTPAAFLLFGERIRPAFVLGGLLAIAGAVLLMGNSVSLSLDDILGDALGIVTAAFYAAYMLVVSRLRLVFSTATIMAWSAVVTAVLLVPVAVLSGESLAATSLYGWTILLGLALVSHAGGQSLIAYAFAYLPASFSSVALLLQPAVAAVLAWLLFSEALGPLQALGGVVILAGLVIARRASQS
jgi:drug/metabolite transporter (DMT)-like permease